MGLLRIWRRWTEPTTDGELARRRESVLLTVLASLIVVSIITQAIQLSGLFNGRNLRSLLIFWAINFSFAWSFYGLLQLARRGRHRLVATVLVSAIWGALAMQTLAGGVDNPMTPLLLALDVVLAAILLGTRASVIVLAAGGCLFTTGVVLDHAGILAPLEPITTKNRSNVGTVLAIVAVLTLMASACWLFTRDVLTSVDELLSHGAATSPLRQLRTKTLTVREIEVVQLVAEGQSNDQIASRLFVSPRTVQSHVANAMKKTSTANRTELGVLAVREGLVPLSHPDDDALQPPSGDLSPASAS